MYEYSDNGYPAGDNDNQEQDNKKTEKRKSAKGSLKIVAVALVCAIAGGGISSAVTSSVILKNRPAVTETAQTETVSKDTSALSVTANSSDTVMTPADIYASYSSAVVGIATESTTMNVFGQLSSSASSGTGFITSQDGYIITNYHVIENAQKITVTTLDGTEYEAKLVGGDEESDVALLKINAQNLKTVSIGNSEDIVTGETLVAIGNPLGELTYTLTVGYVSALDRNITMDDGTTLNMLQTDAAINAGNSGGPLFDLNGNVIAMVTAKYSSSSVEGIGFAIPINDVNEIVTDLVNYGYVKGRPELSVSVQNITSEMSQYYSLPVGVYVAAADSDGAAYNAGVRKGDIITAVNGTATETVAALKAFISDYKAGETVNLTVYRNSQTLTFSVKLDEKSSKSSGESAGTSSNGFNSNASRNLDSI